MIGCGVDTGDKLGDGFAFIVAGFVLAGIGLAFVEGSGRGCETLRPWPLGDGPGFEIGRIDGLPATVCRRVIAGF